MAVSLHFCLSLSLSPLHSKTVFPYAGSYSKCSRLSELSQLFSCCCNTKANLLTRDCVRIKLYFLKKARSSVRAIQNLEILDLEVCFAKSRIGFIIFFQYFRLVSNETSENSIRCGFLLMKPNYRLLSP